MKKMATKKKYYRLSERQLKKNGIPVGVRKYIIVDDSVTPTEQDKQDVKLYMEIGYVLKHKSQERAEKARERAEKTGFGKKKKVEK